MCSESANVFDAHINDTHLQECLKRLIVLYTSSDSRNLHAAEFFAVYLVVNLGSTESLSLGVKTKHLYGSVFVCLVICVPVFVCVRVFVGVFLAIYCTKQGRNLCSFIVFGCFTWTIVIAILGIRLDEVICINFY